MALSVRIDALEQASHARLAIDADDLAAQQVAQELGFAAELVRLPACCKQGANREKKAMANSLLAKGWGKARVARTLRCSERTVARWASVSLKPEV